MAVLHTFESGTESFGGSGTTVSQSSEQAKNGTFSLKAVTDGLGSYQGPERAALATDVPWLPGHRTRLRVWIMGAASQQYLIGWDEYAAGFVYLNSKSKTVTLAGGGWEFFEFEGFPVATAVSLTIKVKTEGTAARTFYVDDFSVYADPDPGPPVFVPMEMMSRA